VKKISVVLTLAVALCFVFTSLVQAGPDDPVTERWARAYLVNKRKAIKSPSWPILQPGTARSVKWVNWANDKRYAVYDSGTTGDNTDDLVLDKTTGLVWTRNTSLGGQTMTWKEGRDYCRGLAMGNVMGFRYPSLTEMYTLWEGSGGLPASTAGLWLNVPTGEGAWWTGSVSYPCIPTMPIIDEDETKFVGAWTYYDIDGYESYNRDFAEHAGGLGLSTATFINISTPPEGDFQVYAWWPAPGSGPTRATDAPFKITYNGSTRVFDVNQTVSSNMWKQLTTGVITDSSLPFTVQLSNDADGYVVADAVRVHFGAEVEDHPPVPYNDSYFDVEMSGITHTRIADQLGYIRATRGPARPHGPYPSSG
jgi:hypothetical protein